MKSPLLQLHDALYMRMKTQAKWLVFDHVPQKQLLPYVSMGATFAKNWSDKLKPGQEIFVSIDFWSGYQGRKEVLEMVGDILLLLTSNDFHLGEDFKAVYSAIESLDIIIDMDGVTRHGILKFRFLIEEI